MRIVDLHLAQHEVRAVAGDGATVTRLVPAEASAEQLNAAGLEAVQQLLGEDVSEGLVRVHAHGSQFIMRASGGVLVPAPEFEPSSLAESAQDQGVGPSAAQAPVDFEQASAVDRAEAAVGEETVQGADELVQLGDQPDPVRDRAGARKVLLLAVAGGVVMLLVLSVVVSALIGRGQADAGDPGDQHSGVQSRSAQLNRPAPVGWSSDAIWSAEANQAGAVAVAVEGLITYGDGQDVVSVDEDFEEVARTDLGTRVMRIEQAPGLGQKAFTVRGADGEVWVGVAGEQLHEITSPNGAGEPTWFSGIPAYSTSDATYVPDTTGSLTRYPTVDGKPVALVGDRLWFISTAKDESPKAWAVAAGQAKAPGPVKVPAPAGEVKYTGEVTGVGEHAGLRFTAGEESVVELLRFGDDGKISDAHAVKIGEGQTSVDPVHELLVAGGTLISVADAEAMSVGDSGVLAAGAFWATGPEAKRVTASGDVQPWEAGAEPDPVIPAAVDSKGQAVVIVPEDDGLDSRLYVLTKEDT